MSNQHSKISYVPQPYFIDGTCTITAHSSVASIENTPGIFDPDLSNFTTVNPTSGATSFAVKIDFAKDSAHLTNSEMTAALIGCSLLTYEDDGGSPNLDTEFSEDIVCKWSSNITALSSDLIAFAHNSQDTIKTFCGTSMPSIISGGRTNIIFTGLGVSNTGGTVTAYATIQRSAANAAARPHAKLLIGHLFVGVDVSLTIAPRQFSWKLAVENERFEARDYGAINSDGTLVKRAAGEFIKIENYELIGSEITSTVPAVTSRPNFFDLVKINTSYPLLFSPYPIDQIDLATVTVEEYNRTARQNFFSIYGFLEDPIEFQTGEYRDGLDTEYRARFRIKETR